MARGAYKLYLDLEDNSLSNGDFESDLSGWTEGSGGGGASGTTAQDATGDSARGSSGSLQIVITGGGTGSTLYRYQTVAASPGELWNVRCRVLGTSYTNTKAYMLVTFQDSGSSELSSTSQESIDVSGDYVTLSDENLTAPANTAYIRILLAGYVTSTGGTGTMNFDLVEAFRSYDLSDDLEEVPDSYHGRDYDSQTYGKSVAGRFQAMLLNENGKYNRFNSSGVFFGQAIHGRRLRWLMDAGSGYDYLWAGYLDSIDPVPGSGGYHKARISGIGPLSTLLDRKVYSATQTSITPGDAVHAVMNAAAHPHGYRDVDDGTITMALWYSHDQLSFDALRDIEETEAGFLRETKDGLVRFEENNRRLTGSYLTSQENYGESGYDPFYEVISSPDPIKDVANIVQVPVYTISTGSLTVLWTLGEIPALTAGESRTFVATYPLPDSASEDVGVNAWTTPVSTTDYTANSQSDGMGTDMTSDITISVVKAATKMLITVTNTHVSSTAYLTLLQARGTPMSQDSPSPIQVQDNDSIADYGEREYLIPARFLSATDDAVDYGNYVLQLQKDPLPKLELTYPANQSQTALEDALARDLSDRVTVNAVGDSDLGIQEDFYIEGITHRLDIHGQHQVKLLLSPCRIYSTIIILDTGPALDTGILGR